MSEPLATFRLYPEPGRTLYVRVNVWPTRAALHAHIHASGDPIHRKPGGWSTAANCVQITARMISPSGRIVRTRPLVAEVNFHRGEMGTFFVTHEFFHAAIAYGRRIGFDWSRLDAEDSVNDDEERLTYAHSRLCADFVKRALAAGLYDEDRWRRPARAA